MSHPHLEIQTPAGRLRAELDGPLRLAAAGGDLSLSGAGGGLLRLEPGRASWSPQGAAGAEPLLDGAPFDAAGAPTALADGARIQWGAVQLEYRSSDSESRPSGRAQAAARLVELDPVDLAPEPVPAHAQQLSPLLERAWRRVWSGLLVEQGLAPSGATAAAQDEVRRRELDADRAADRILAGELPAEADQRVLDRARALQRDLLMAPLNTAPRRAARRVQARATSGLAFLVAQGLTLGVYSFMVLVALVLLRQRGFELDGFLDRILGLFGAGGD